VHAEKLLLDRPKLQSPSTTLFFLSPAAFRCMHAVRTTERPYIGPLQKAYTKWLTIQSRYFTVYESDCDDVASSLSSSSLAAAAAAELAVAGLFSVALVLSLAAVVLCRLWHVVHTISPFSSL